MSGVEFGFLMFGAMLVLLAIRVPIGIAMLLTGVAGYVTLTGWAPLLNYLKTVAYSRFSVYDLSVIPMFLLMGQFASRGGLSQSLFNAANAVIGHWRGGVAMAAVGACAGFGAICGSSLATAATMGQVALPELRRLKYEPALATGTLAAGGTLGILIPPSIVLVVYAILAEQNIAKLFMAAFVPGIIAALGYMIAIGIYVRLKPGSGPAGERHTLGASDSSRCATCGRCCCCSWWSSAASTAASSRRPKRRRSAPPARCSSPSGWAACAGTACSSACTAPPRPPA